MTKKEAKDDDSSDDDSEFSDIDYSLPFIPSHLHEISETRLNELWNKQSGCCYITNIPMSVDQTTLSIYSIDVAPRRITEPISDQNSILVTHGIKLMQESVNLTWTQFRSFMALCAGGID